MASTLMRVSDERADRVRAHADEAGRTYVSELDRIIDAGLEALYGKPTTAKRGGRKAG